MKYALGAGVALIALGMSGQAMAACPDDINNLRTDLQKNESFQQRYVAGRIDRTSYRRLFDAAQTFSETGLEKRCQEVLAGIRELSEKAEAQAPARPPAAQADRREPRSADRPPADMRRADRETDRTKRLEAAQPLAAVDISFENLVGADVRNVRNEDLGDVEDFVMTRGQVTSVIIARGGFLGMGVNYHMVSVKQAKVANLDDDRDDKKGRVLVLDLSDDQTKALPRVTKKNGTWMQAAAADRPATPDRRATPGAPPSTPDGRPRQ